MKTSTLSTPFQIQPLHLPTPSANISSISRIPSTQIQLLLDTPVLANETGIILSYTNTSNFITDLNGTALGNVTNQSVSNNIPKTPPIIIDASTNNAGNIITITFNEDIDLVDSVPNSAFTFTNTNANISSISRIPSTQIQLLLDTPVLANETGIILSYTNTSNFITDLNGTALGNVTNQSVSNNIPKTPPIIIDASRYTNNAGNIITITFDKNITLAGTVPNSAFTFTNTNANISSISRIPSTQIQLLLDTPVLANETGIILSYTNTSNFITDLNGTALGNVTNQSISNNIPKTPPIIIDTSANNAGNIITITFDKNITLAGTVPNSDFTFSNTKAAVSSINQTSPSKQIQLTLNPPILANETGINLGYRNSSNNITDLNGTALGDIELMSDGRNLSVSNNIPKTPPIIINASTNNAGNIITITFNEDITLAGPVPNSDFTFTNTSANISSISRIPSTQIQLLLDTPVLANETGIILSYTNTSNFITDLNGTALGNVTNQSISNDIPKTPPIIINASTNNAGNIITITFNENITLVGPVPNSAFTFTNTNANVSSISRIPSTQIQLLLDTPVLANETGIILSYTNTSNFITDLNGTALGNVTNQSISNDIPKTPPIIINASTNNAGNIITITFDKNITLAGTTSNSAFTFTNTNANISSISRIPPTQIQLQLDTPVLANEVGIILSYTNTTNFITDLNGTALGNVSSSLSTNTATITVTLSTTISTPTNSDSIPITITFSEDVTGFESSDITISNANITNFTGSGAAYTVDLEPPTFLDDIITMSVPANVANNASLVPNIASNVLSIIYDSIGPNITISNTTIHTYRAVDDASVSVMQYGLGIQCSDLTLSNYTENNPIVITKSTELCFSSTDTSNNINYAYRYITIPTIQFDSIPVHENNAIVGFDINTTTFVQIQPNIQNTLAHFINTTGNVTLNSNLTISRIGVDDTIVPTNITLLLPNRTILQSVNPSFILLDPVSLVVPSTFTTQYTTVSSTLVGMSDDSITFTSPIQITFTDQAGKSLLPHYQKTLNHAPDSIDTICSSANDIQQIESQLNGDGECTLEHESDVIIWTYYAAAYGLVSVSNPPTPSAVIISLNDDSFDDDGVSGGNGSISGGNGSISGGSGSIGVASSSIGVGSGSVSVASSSASGGSGIGRGSLISGASIGDSTSSSSSAFTLYEISWNTVNSEKIIETIIGPQSENIFTTIDGKITDVTSTPSLIQPYLDRTIYVGSIDSYETFIYVRVGMDVNNLFSTINKYIDVSQSKGSIIYDSSPPILNPIVPSVSTVEPTNNNDVVDEIPIIEEELEEIEPTIETTPLDDMSDVVDSKTDGGCLVATAVYGTELSQQVQMLREIRDTTLMTSIPGISFMTSFNQIYYTFSPIIADAERENPLLRNMIQILLGPLLSSTSILNLNDSSTDHIFTLGLIIFVLNLLMYIAFPIFIIFRVKKIVHMITSL